MGISIETIHSYEAQGLLPPAARAADSYRVYTPGRVRRLAFITKCRSPNMTHTKIHRLLELQISPQASCEEISNLLDEHLRYVEARITEPTDLKDQTEAIGQRCMTAASVAECGVLQPLHKESATTHLQGHSHEHGEGEYAHWHTRDMHR